MQVDKSSFLLFVGTLAAGGAGGYVAGERNLLGSREPVPPKEAALSIASVGAPAASATAAPAAPPAVECDDMTGAVGTCPAVGYSAEEGGCGALPSQRCLAFKAAFKPKVAERAVACIDQLKAGEQCSASRLTLCGHLALMSACPEPGDLEHVGAAPPGSAMAVCASILASCTTSPIAPTMRDCVATLAGMNELGRGSMLECMRTHCGDKGLLGCEGAVELPK